MATFVVQGLASRGGLSNWVLFAQDDGVVLCDVGMAPAIAMGVAAGMGVMTEPRSASVGSEKLDAWCEELCKTSKSVVRVEDARIARVRLVQSVLPHQLYVEEKDGTSRKFGFLDRPFSAGVDEPLRQRFGEKFDLVVTKPFAFLRSYLPFLLK